MENRLRPRMSLVLMVMAVAIAGTVASCSTAGHSATPTSSTPGTTSAAAGPIPAQYAAMVSQLNGELDGYQAAVNAMPNTRKADRSTPALVPAVELLAANGNQQTKLLAPGALTAVEQELDALKRLGVTGVTIGIKLPLLLTQFTPQAAQYADFYAAVAEQARDRGFTIDVELGGLFCGTVYSTCQYAYPTTVAGWAALTAQQAQIVMARVHPDYLDILSEPNTEANLTSIPALETLDGVIRFVTATLAQIGPHGTTKIGAGAASWFPVSFDQAIAATDVDVLIEHIYPLSPGITRTILATAALAHQIHKPLVADEVWLYKGTPTAGNNVTESGTAGQLDAYSFFEPLDKRFLSITRKWSEKADVAFTSPFWSAELFSYVKWTPALDADPPGRTLSLLEQAAATAVADGTESASGRIWGRSH